jgi:hypothetical protein
MFAIKREQREKMGEPAFIDRTVEWLRYNHLPFVHDLDDDELRLRVRHGVEKARGYGLTWESSLTIFVSHMLTINPDFDRQPAVQVALTDPKIPGDEKMQALLGLVTDDEWEEAAKMVDPALYWDAVRKASGAPAPAEQTAPRRPRRAGSPRPRGGR